MPTFSFESYLSHRSSRINTSAIRKVFDLAQNIQNPLDLSIGQPDFAVPLPVKEAIQKAIQDNHTKYTPTKGILPLRNAIAEHYTKEYDHAFHPDNILVSNGTANILFLLFDTLFDPLDSIIVIEPYFLIYRSLAEYHQMQIYYLSEHFTKNDIETIYNVANHKPKKPIKAIIFSSPSNPTGNILNQQQIEWICQCAEKYNTIIISDEIYKTYDYEQHFYSPASILPQNTIILNGFSKSHAMTGFRVGYMVVDHSMSSISNSIANIQQYSSVCSPAPMQWGAIVALQTSTQNHVDTMKHSRDIVLSYLRDKVEFVYPEGAFYVFIKVPIDCIEFVKKAIEKRLLVVPGNIFTHNNNYIRISYTPKESILKEGLEIFMQIVMSKS